MNLPVPKVANAFKSRGSMMAWSIVALKIRPMSLAKFFRMIIVLNSNVAMGFVSPSAMSVMERISAGKLTCRFLTLNRDF